ncbi:MAG: AmmeMemoRadiSam system protein B [Nanoarchaeota archaeon]
MIKPIVAGQFYPSGKEALIKQVEECFSSKLGAGKPAKKAGKSVFGVIAPHAGYPYSGYGASFAYKKIAESKKPKRFVILAPDHNGVCYNMTTSFEDWETPLGIVKADRDFISKLISKCPFLKQGAIHEHAVEVQLPFLRYIYPDARIVPIVIPSPANCKELGKAIASISKDTIVIASSDFTHYGAYYGFMPFTAENAKEGMKKLDLNAIKFIEQLDSERFYKYVEKTGATICGQYAIMAAIEAVKAMGAKKAALLKYYTSGDVSKDYNSAVGYAAVEFV